MDGGTGGKEGGRERERERERERLSSFVPPIQNLATCVQLLIQLLLDLRQPETKVRYNKIVVLFRRDLILNWTHKCVHIRSVCLHTHTFGAHLECSEI